MIRKNLLLRTKKLIPESWNTEDANSMQENEDSNISIEDEKDDHESDVHTPGASYSQKGKTVVTTMKKTHF